MKQHLAEKYPLWLLIGGGTFILFSLYALSRAIPGLALTDALPASIDWVAACLTYLYIGAALGAAITARRQHSPQPTLVWLVLGFWVAGSAVAVISLWPLSWQDALLAAFFPLAYGIFFPSYAWVTLAGSMASSWVGKTLFNLALLAMSGTWVWLTYRGANATQLQARTRRALLFAIVIVLTIGAVSCARELS